MCEEGFESGEADGFYQARDFLAQWVRYYNEGRLHSALHYLRPVDYYRGNPEALLADREKKIKEATARRKEMNKCFKLTEANTGV